MAFFDELGKKVSEAGQKTLQKTKEISDTTRINSMISDEEKTINNNYYQIGKLYVSLHGNDYEDEFSGMISAIAESEKKIREYRNQVQEIKGVRRCANCGAEVPRGSAFCSSCGEPMPKVETMIPVDMVKCEGCGALVKKDMRFCTSCGKPMSSNQRIMENPESANTIMVEARKCPNCGMHIDGDELFCSECGTKIE